MMLRCVILVVCLMTFKRDVHVSSCDQNCTDKPVFTPSRLVVKHGDPTSATCSVCQSVCKGTLFNLETPLGTKSVNGTTIKWTVDKMTEWETSPSCFYNVPDITDQQCCTDLPITVYKPPDSVSISIFNHNGLMYEGRQYTLQCAVQNVAPIGNLAVTFYRGNTPLGQPLSVNNPAKKPVSDTYSQSITASKEDDGAQYWCEAKLELGSEGPHPPPVVKSQNITTTVYYKPYLQGTSNPDPIPITEGRPLKLNCLAVGNPPPTYTWMLPGLNRSSNIDSFLTIDSVKSADKGQYSCTVSNTIGSQTVMFNVDVQYKPYLRGRSNPDPITITEGRPLKLNCSAVGNPPPTYTWMLPGLNRSSNIDSLLTIDSVKSADKGQYSCTVRNTIGSETVTFNVDVQYKPYLQGTSNPDPITIIEGRPLKLNCSAVGNPPPTYTWMLPGLNRSSNINSVLTIDPVKSADKGQYSCTVHNTMGSQTVTFNVDVQYKPYLQGRSNPDPITITEGRPLKLNCSAVGNPPPTYTWMLPGLNRSSNIDSLLTIDSVKSADKGQYSCTVRNTIGSQTVTFNVDVQYKPYLKGRSHPDPIAIPEGHPLKLNCSAVGNPPPTYTWMLPGLNRSSNNDSFLTIDSVKSADKGQYSCTVRNTMGSQTVTFNVDVQRLTTTSPPQNIGTHGKLIHRFTLCCMLLMSVLV